jgi:predicted RNase H-like HicB family nuclease
MISSQHQMLKNSLQEPRSLLGNIFKLEAQKNKRSFMEKLHLPILVEIDEDGLYIVSCPLFKGCHSWGETIDEAMKNISEVVDMCLEETEIGSFNTFVGFRELEVVHNAKATCD